MRDDPAPAAAAAPDTSMLSYDELEALAYSGLVSGYEKTILDSVIPTKCNDRISLNVDYIPDQMNYRNST